MRGGSRAGVRTGARWVRRGVRFSKAFTPQTTKETDFTDADLAAHNPNAVVAPVVRIAADLTSVKKIHPGCAPNALHKRLRNLNGRRVGARLQMPQR